MAVLAAATGDPLAPRFWAYVDANPTDAATYALHAVGFVERMLDHTVPTAASFTYTSSDGPKVVELGPGEAFHLTLIASQLGSFTIEPRSGAIAVSSSWREPVAADSFAKDPDITITRTIKPSGAIRTSDVVAVDLVVAPGVLQGNGCVMVTDFVPSGLVPVGRLRGWVDSEEEDSAANASRPVAVAGQQVSFCAERPARGNTVRLRYYARVISPGTYTWEPAIAQSPFRPDSAALTAATKIRIR
jgi:alpha-2-macroglobulin